MVFPKQRRIVRKNEVKKIALSRWQFQGQHYSAKLSKENSATVGFRILVSVSKKISKLAVIRNRLRRRIQGYFDNLDKDLLEQLGCFSCFLVVRNKEMCKTNSINLDSDLKKLVDYLLSKDQNGQTKASTLQEPKNFSYSK